MKINLKNCDRQTPESVGRASLRWLLGNVVVMLPTPPVCDRNYNPQLPPQHYRSLPENQRFRRQGLTGNVHLVSLVGLAVTCSLKMFFLPPFLLKFWSRSHLGLLPFRPGPFLSGLRGERFRCPTIPILVDDLRQGFGDHCLKGRGAP